MREAPLSLYVFMAWILVTYTGIVACTFIQDVPAERSVFWDVVVSVILSKKVYMCMRYFTV
jgi:hypothetical protein